MHHCRKTVQAHCVPCGLSCLPPGDSCHHTCASPPLRQTDPAAPGPLMLLPGPTASSAATLPPAQRDGPVLREPSGMPQRAGQCRAGRAGSWTVTSAPATVPAAVAAATVRSQVGGA
ncbi:hypothetical protein GWK47_025761 [Chionoecetes opilio]|uniref:Uncharacterized protein n=1 Tax=Chionoecetes opilio TaxID=41210 RepID=A0A8J8WMZ2_CHIOP|nr:hypothetical protein GWK47_025761 [Chionoecetes opilio]